MDRELECCGRPTAAECRCYTDATEIAAAVHAFVSRRVRHRQDAEDVTQDALLRLYRSARELRDEDALEGWMYRIARSAIIDHQRRAARGPEPVDPGAAGLEVVAAELPEQPAEQELAQCLPALVDRIPERYSEALRLTDLGELTQEQAAEQLGLSTSGMKSRVQRGRRLLRAEVARCCRVELDSRGALADAEPRRPDAC